MRNQFLCDLVDSLSWHCSESALLAREFKKATSALFMRLQLVNFDTYFINLQMVVLPLPKLTQPLSFKASFLFITSFPAEYFQDPP